MIKNILLWLLCKINQPITSPSTGFCVSCRNSHEIEIPVERLKVLDE